jgi:hypothetical protein
MATSYIIDEGPELTPKLKGNKVVFARKPEPKSASKSSDKGESNQPQTIDAAEGAARGEKSGRASK